jgi:glycosyltransferase involved in cell wall biosynthesis
MIKKGKMKKDKTISVIVITKNEEHDIGRCLESLAWAGEIILVDSGSTDDTVRIAKRLGAKVYYKKWAGYAEQKNFAISKTKGKWILCVDADETIPGPLKEELLSLTSSNPDKNGYYIPRENYFYGKLMKHGGLYPDGQVRIFRKGKGHFPPILLHETLKIEGETGWLKNPMKHFTKNTIKEHIEAANKYTGLETEQRLICNYAPTGYSVILKPFFRFIRYYFFKGGLLDGFNGLVYHVITAFMMFVSEIKILEAREFKDNLVLTLFKRAK